MFIPNYYDVVTIVVIGINNKCVECISCEKADELLLHTLSSISDYIESVYNTTCTLLSMKIRSMQSNNDIIAIADFVIQLD